MNYHELNKKLHIRHLYHTDGEYLGDCGGDWFVAVELKINSGSSKLIKFIDFDVLVWVPHLDGGNMTNKCAPRDIRPNWTGYFGFCMLSRSLNCRSNLDQSTKYV